MTERPILHPAAVQRALDVEAEAWAAETDVRGFVARLSSDPPTREALLRLAKQFFTEGAYRGAVNVLRNKPLRFTLEAAGES